MSLSPAPAIERSATDATEFDYPARRRRLASLLETEQLGEARVALICDPLDIAYLSGVREGISWLAIWVGGGFAVTRHMLVREVVEKIGDFEVLLPSERSTDRLDLGQFVIEQLKRRGMREVVVNPERMNAAAFLGLRQHAEEEGLSLATMSPMVETLRQCKDGAERELTCRCIAIAEEAFLGLIEGGAGTLVGRSELQLARELESRMVALGADRQGFPETGVIVASGTNSASAHHVPGDRLIREGEPLLIDWGAELDGYRSDMTRTLFLGAVPDFAREAYPVVLDALEAAAAVLRAGVAMGEVDHAAREAVITAGYPEFHYGVGHGIGLAIHEDPWLRAHSEVPVRAGMITTIEPGIYLPGQGGIRIESIYAVSEATTTRLDSLPTAFEEMVIS